VFKRRRWLLWKTVEFEVVRVEDVVNLLRLGVVSKKGSLLLTDSLSEEASVMVVEWDRRGLTCVLNDRETTAVVVSPDGVDLGAMELRKDGSAVVTDAMARVSLDEVLLAVTKFVRDGGKEGTVDWAEGPSLISHVGF
jgi:hypothetical protein